MDERTEAEMLDALVAQVKDGDARAFDELLRRCHPRIYRWALVATGDRDDADDVAQEVLVRLDRELHRFRGRSRFTTWLYRVTRNAATSLHRKRDAAKRATEGARDDDPHVDHASQWAESLETSGLVELVTAFFRDLPARQREVFDLVELQGVPQAEAAEMLAMNPATVRAHLFRARRAIRARIIETHPALVKDRAP